MLVSSSIGVVVRANARLASATAGCHYSPKMVERSIVENAADTLLLIRFEVHRICHQPQLCLDPCNIPPFRTSPTAATPAARTKPGQKSLRTCLTVSTRIASMWNDCTRCPIHRCSISTTAGDSVLRSGMLPESQPVVSMHPGPATCIARLGAGSPSLSVCRSDGNAQAI